MTTTHRLGDLGVVLTGVWRERRAAAVRALYAEAELIATRSRVLTPVKTGALKGSHHVPPPETSGDTTTVRIAVGGPAAPYALVVHEDLEARRNSGQPKFLETAAAEAAPGLSARLTARIDAEGV